ncbi:MAG: class I SAM-dependent methyltransferase [Nanoarchaeota archaeon]|nr:class I SAM-dependent methyltransferase [Nanoarchaeota archaeon]
MKNAIKANKRFFDFWAPYYDRGIFGRFLFNIIDKTANSVKIKKGSKILDAGCGTGNLLHILGGKNLGLKLYGTDISKKMMQIARKKVKEADIREISVTNLNKEFRENYFDYVFSVDAFHHFPNRRIVMNNFYRILRYNGRLVITDFDFGIILNKIFSVLEPGNTGVYTKEQMKDLFKKSGFIVEKQQKIGLFSLMTIGKKQR